MKLILIAYTIFAFTALYGCGDTVSQSATGGGSNCNSHDGSCGIVTPLPEGTTEAGDVNTAGASSSTSNPQKCPVQPPVHPSCSVKSQLNCDCVLPN